jgi:hypothetical protein
MIHLYRDEPMHTPFRILTEIVAIDESLSCSATVMRSWSIG